VTQPDFTDLPDLASELVGGATLLTNDDFFAAKENLLKPHPAEWREHEYTDRGKWMDGWESRRRREPGYDWCVIRLGLPGIVRGVVVDTSYFRGNFPAECSIEAAELHDVLDLRAIETAHWTELLPRSALQGHHANTFAIGGDARVTHLRLNIFPDGGVARLRVHGEVVPDWRRLRALGGVIDLAALEHGAWVESCSDMFFGSRNNLIKPGPSRTMADGWETRRRRGPGNDWAIVRLAAPGMIERVEVDTSHFKGNAPGRVTLEGRDARIADDPWRELVSTPAQPHTRHVLDAELRRAGMVTHLRLSVFPDGGVARLRAWGSPEPSPFPSLAAATVEDFQKCCGSTAWARRMMAQRPFEDAAALQRIGERTWWQLEEADWLEAFAAHPKIGERSASAWSTAEQANAQAGPDAARAELLALNQQYVDRHGFIYIVCASGRPAEELLEDLRARVGAPRAREVRVAAEEQAKILRLRLARWLSELQA